MSLDKCIFGVKKGKLLGCLVSGRGIKANPEKIVAIVNMKRQQARSRYRSLWED